MAPERIRCTATAVWARSPRCLGNSTPRLTSPTWWPARPTRWRALATLGGLSIWMTRSTAPMSMPSSRLLVATTAGSRPRLRSSSMSARCSLETEPWWALAMTASMPLLEPDWAMISAGTLVRLRARSPVARSVAISLSRAVSRSASRRLLAKTIVLLCCSIRSTTCSSTCGQIDCALRRLAAVLVVLAGLGHVLDRDDDLEVPLLGAGRRDDLDRCAAAEEPRHLLQRPHRRAQPDPLGGLVEQRVEPLEGDREVGAALGAGHGVHLVDDHRLDAAQALAGLAGEHQEQRLRRRDHDVGRLGDEPAPVGGRGVAGADADGHLGDLLAEPVAGVADAGQRAAQVALDVDRERLERADVEHPGPLGLVGGTLAGQQPVEAPQERAQRLAGPRRRHHERVLTGPDRLPRAHLGRRRLRERRREPRARGLAEAAQRVMRRRAAVGAGRGHGAKSCSRHRQRPLDGTRH